MTDKAMLAAAPEPTPLPDDVAAMVERLRTGGETYEELLDLCTRQAADMLERLARENESIKNDLGQQLLDAAKTITAVKAENEKLREDAERWNRLVTAHKFNNKPAVGFAINRAIDAAIKGEK